jgi:hypothetical protein
LLRYRSLSRVGDALVVEDQAGERQALTDATHEGEPATLHLLPLLPEAMRKDQALLLRFYHDLDSQTLHAKPLSVLTETEIVRLAY